MDFGFMGSEIASTPNLDQLARSGSVFPRGFSTASVCRPALRSLLTGLHPAEFESRWTPRRARQAGPGLAWLGTLPERVATGGYASFQGGKHWEGHYSLSGFSHGMTVSSGDAGADFEGLDGAAGAEGLALGRDGLEPLFEFIDARGEQPFLAWFAPMLPHVPHDASPELLARYDGLGLGRRALAYYANVSRLDDRVGELLRHLEARGLREKTVVVFLVDNGWETLGRGDAQAEIANLGGNRGKLSIYELGFRTPVVISWPGVLPEGERFEALVSLVDVAATLVDLSGAAPLPGREGQSLLPLLTGTGSFDRERVIGSMTELRDDSRRGRLARSGKTWFVRTPSWRYVWGASGEREELYRIEEDPLETNDVASEHPREVERLRGLLTDWVERIEHDAAGFQVEAAGSQL